MPNTPDETTKAEKLAAAFHETYERLAPSFGYETRKASAVPWENVPEQNRRLMTAVAAELLRTHFAPLAPPPPAGELGKIEELLKRRERARTAEPESRPDLEMEYCEGMAAQILFDLAPALIHAADVARERDELLLCLESHRKYGKDCEAHVEKLRTERDEAVRLLKLSRQYGRAALCYLWKSTSDNPEKALEKTLKEIEAFLSSLAPAATEEGKA